MHWYREMLTALYYCVGWIAKNKLCPCRPENLDKSDPFEMLGKEILALEAELSQQVTERRTRMEGNTDSALRLSPEMEAAAALLMHSVARPVRLRLFVGGNH